MMEPHDIIDEHFFNRELIAVWAMLCGSSGMDIEGYALSFEGYLIEIEMMLDTSAVGISYDHSRCDFPYDVRPGCSYDEVSDKKPFSNLLGKRLSKWRLLVSENGNWDGLLLSFGTTSGLCFVSVDYSLSVMLLDGIQC